MPRPCPGRARCAGPEWSHRSRATLHEINGLELTLRIATWNVNSLTARLQHVLDWLAANPVDVLCLQDLKMSDDKFPLEVLRALRDWLRE
jgi:hypothetical protein